MKHRGKELLTTEFRCFANYPRLTRSRCSNTDPLIYLHLRLSISPFLSPSRTPGPVASTLSCSSSCSSASPRPPLSRASLYRASSRETIISQGPLANSHPALRILSISALKQVWLVYLSIASLPLLRFASSGKKWEMVINGLASRNDDRLFKILAPRFSPFFFCRPPRGFNCVEREVIRIILFR